MSTGINRPGQTDLYERRVGKSGWNPLNKHGVALS
jgi:hypothetical protein